MASNFRGERETGRDNFPYAATRVKARKSTLIPKAQYEKFLVMDLPSITRFIGETEYAKEINELSTKYSGLDLVEMATYENLARNFHEVLEFCRGNLKLVVERYLTIWDTWNIKTILRGKSYQASSQEILDDLVPAGTFSREDLRKMVAAEDIDALLEHLKGTEFYKHVKDARTAGGDVDLMKLENHLEKDYYADLLTISTGTGWVNKIILRFFREKIDLVNLKTLFKLKYAEMEPEFISSYLLPGGYEMNMSHLKQLAGTAEMVKCTKCNELIPALATKCPKCGEEFEENAGAAAGPPNFDRFLNELKSYRFWPAIKDAAEAAAESGTLNMVMSALDAYHFKNAAKFGKLYPLSLLPFLDYFIWKKIEVDNIRIICRGKQAGLSEDLIRSMLIT